MREDSAGVRITRWKIPYNKRPYSRKDQKGGDSHKGGRKASGYRRRFFKSVQEGDGNSCYTLIYNSYGLKLVQHVPFESIEKAIVEGIDIISETKVVEFAENRKLVRDTDIGKSLIEQIEDLKQLLHAYRNGLIRK